MTTIEANVPLSLSDASLEPRGDVYSSPTDWRNEVFYFLLPDRFSDGNETDDTLCTSDMRAAFKTADKEEWMKQGKKFQGGTINGIKSKLPYLKELGITTLWIAPTWKQRAAMDTYHGYGIQNFLDIDPRFGTRQELRNLVDEAHQMGMRIVLDIIYNHTGDNWFYRDENGNPKTEMKYCNPPYHHDFLCWRDKDDAPLYSLPTDMDDGVWPREFQNTEWYTRAGSIDRWDPHKWENRLHDNCPWRRGDFFSLKDLDLSKDEVLSAVIKVYSYWIAVTDCDGYRIDTVKHVPFEASRKFCGAIREYAESIGKYNFLLLGEVTGGSGMVKDYLEISGINVDAALDIGDPTKEMAGVVQKGWAPHAYFKYYTQSTVLGSHRMVGKYHVTILDDHDKVGATKTRFANPNSVVNPSRQIAQVVCMQMTSLGIPCVYYGTEQAFDGNKGMHDYSLDSDGSHLDRYIRESMFTSRFGAFETEGCHFFDTNNSTYKRIASLIKLRMQDTNRGKALRYGRLYQRQISFDGGHTFVTPPEGGRLIAWSRIHAGHEVLIVLNIDAYNSQTGYVTVDKELNLSSHIEWLFYNGDSETFDNSASPSSVPSRHNFNGRETIKVVLPPSGIAIFG